MSSELQEQALALSPSNASALNTRASACSTDEPLVQRSDPCRRSNALGATSLQMDAPHFNDRGAHNLKLSNDVVLPEVNGKQSTTRNSKPLVKSSGSQTIELHSLQHKHPISPAVHASTVPAQTAATIQLPMVHETSKEVALAQQPSKEIIKFSLDEDDVEDVECADYVKVLPCVGAFTVQCALCMKWRLIPTKEQYEEIRESVSEKPFFCSSAAGWRPNVSCEDPSDVSQDEKHLWAIDRPNIPIAPAGWERQLVIRAAGASKFADVYYVAPSGRKLRSMPEVERFLAEFPEYIRAGVRHSQFSFIIPRPLDTNYCRKKTTSTSSFNESQRKSKSKQAQAKKYLVKRKAFESLSCKEDSDELNLPKKVVKAEKSSNIGNRYDNSIMEQVVKASIPPEELMKGLFASRSVDSRHVSSLRVSHASSNSGRPETPLKENL